LATSLYESTNIYRIWIPHKRKVISAREFIFDESEFFNGKPTRLTQELLDTLDEAVELVEVTKLAENEDIQLPDTENESPDSEEAPIDQIHQEEIDDDNEEMDINKSQGLTEPTWESTIYSTPPPSTYYLSNADVSLPVKSEGVKVARSLFSVFPTEKVPDLPDPPDIEPAIIDQIKQQQDHRFFNFRRKRVPQIIVT
jgi:hypothetical protein